MAEYQLTTEICRVVDDTVGATFVDGHNTCHKNDQKDTWKHCSPETEHYNIFIVLKTRVNYLGDNIISFSLLSG